MIVRSISAQFYRANEPSFEDIDVLMNDPADYGGPLFSLPEFSSSECPTGSYAGAGHILMSMNTAGPISNYGRWLDLDQALAKTSWTQNNVDYLR